jgi:hypothetical protein
VYFELRVATCIDEVYITSRPGNCMELSVCIRNIGVCHDCRQGHTGRKIGRPDVDKSLTTRRSVHICNVLIVSP